jgi:hypothetical protein
MQQPPPDRDWRRFSLPTWGCSGTPSEVDGTFGFVEMKTSCEMAGGVGAKKPSGTEEDGSVFTLETITSATTASLRSRSRTSCSKLSRVTAVAVTVTGGSCPCRSPEVTTREDEGARLAAGAGTSPSFSVESDSSMVPEGPTETAPGRISYEEGDTGAIGTEALLHARE